MRMMIIVMMMIIMVMMLIDYGYDDIISIVILIELLLLSCHIIIADANYPVFLHPHYGVGVEHYHDTGDVCR